MKRRLFTSAFAAALALSAMAGPTLAGQPEEPGCFGQDRAAWLHANGGGKVWGPIAADRAGDNGAINQAYKTGCGGDPTP